MRNTTSFFLDTNIKSPRRTLFSDEIELHGTFTSIHLKLLPFEFLLRNLFLLWFCVRSYFGEGLFFLNKHDLNVAWRRHVRIDPTVGSVSSPSHLGSSVHLNVVNHQMISIETLVLSIGFSILQEVKQELGRLDGPPTLRCTVNLSL